MKGHPFIYFCGKANCNSCGKGAEMKAWIQYPECWLSWKGKLFYLFFLSLRGDSGTGATAEVSDPTCLGEGATGILLVG